MKQMNRKSYLGDACAKAIEFQLDKMINVDKEAVYYSKEKVCKLEAQNSALEGDIYSYQQQADQLESELESLLKINDMYQETIKQLEEVISNKDRIIADHLMTIGKLTEGQAQDLQDIRMMFFSQQKDLVNQIAAQRAKFKKASEKFSREITTWEAIEKKYKKDIGELKEEILLAKKILKDPNLSTLASRKFHNTIDQTNDRKMVVEGAQIHDIIEQENEKAEEFEVEIERPMNRYIPGCRILYNKEVPAASITIQNQFKKLNFSQFTPQTIKIRRAGGRST